MMTAGRGKSRMIRRWAILGLGLLAALLLAGFGRPQAARAATTWFVDGSIGNNANACTSAAAPCLTLGGVLAKPPANGDTIQIAAGTYNEKNILTKSLIIIGSGSSGPGDTVFDGSGLPAGSMFTVNSGVTVTLQGMAIVNSTSSTNGGGILNNGSLTLTNADVVNNSAGIFGGGIENAGTLTLNNVGVISNSSSGASGGIDNIGSATLNNVILVSNLAGNAGGIYSRGGGATISLTSVLLVSNVASSGPGGAIEIAGGTATLTNVFLVSNSAGISGGGVANFATTKLTNVTLVSNSATGLAGGGGGILNASGSATLTNVTLVANSTTGTTSNGGGIDNIGGTMRATNVTLSGNSAPAGQGGGIANSAALTLQASIVAAGGGTGGDCSGSAFTSNGDNISDDATCNTSLTNSGDLTSTVPLLGALANNSGPSVGLLGAISVLQTMALLPGSPAIDHFPTSACLAAFAALSLPPTDERGITRPQGPACDSGAFEVQVSSSQPVSAPATSVSSVTVSPSPSTPAVRATYIVGFTTSGSGALGPGSTITLVTPNGTDFLGVLGNYSVSTNNGHSATAGNVAVSAANGSGTNNQLVLTLSSSSIAAGDRVTLSAQNVLNPSAGAHTASLATSADTQPVTSAPYSIGTPTPTASPTPSATPSPTPTPGCATVTYATGWNLAGGPNGTVLAGAAGSLFTFQASDSAYESFPVSTVLSGGVGVWAFFFTPTTVTLPCVTGSTQSILLPVNHFIMVANPFDRPATLSAAQVVDTFNTATNSYTTVTGTVTLQPGQGAWVFSSSGGTLTITST